MTFDAENLRRVPALPVRWGARLLDVMVAFSALVLLCPVMIVVAAAIFVESGRPIFFSQVRLGLRGRHFRMHKFRKFYERRGEPGCPLTMENDRRSTRVGRVLARTKLDELPQIWNVLRGDMSIVGPRPESLHFADCFAGPCRRVLDHKPGIFGPSQVLFRNEARFYRGSVSPEHLYRTVLFPLKARIDIEYFSRRTLPGDAMWVIRGGLAVFGCSFGRQLRQAIVEAVNSSVPDAERRLPELALAFVAPSPGGEQYNAPRASQPSDAHAEGQRISGPHRASPTVRKYMFRRRPTTQRGGERKQCVTYRDSRSL